MWIHGDPDPQPWCSPPPPESFTSLSDHSLVIHIRNMVFVTVILYRYRYKAGKDYQGIHVVFAGDSATIPWPDLLSLQSHWLTFNNNNYKWEFKFSTYKQNQCCGFAPRWHGSGSENSSNMWIRILLFKLINKLMHIHFLGQFKKNQNGFYLSNCFSDIKEIDHKVPLASF